MTPPHQDATQPLNAPQGLTGAELDYLCDVYGPPTPEDDLWLTDAFCRDEYRPPRREGPQIEGQLSIEAAIEDAIRIRDGLTGEVRIIPPRINPSH